MIQAFERSDWREIEVRVGDASVHLVADGHTPTEAAPKRSDDAVGAGGPSAEHTEASTAVPAGSHIVAAPSPGVFWRAPEPGAPPFAEVGHRVDPDTTLCIIEVMKLMSHVKAGVGGTVVAIPAEDGDTIGTGQALFAIDVTAS